MICKKCGADCDPLQFFCLKCGAPLEKETSDANINLLDENEEINLSENSQPIDLGDTDEEVNLILNDNVDIEKRTVKKPERRPERRPETRLESSRNSNSNRNVRKESESKDSNNENNSNKKKFIIIGAIIAVIIIAIIIASLLLNKSSSFEEYYNNAEKLYNSGKVEDSIPQFEKAVDAAENDDDRIKTYKMLWQIYAMYDNRKYDEIEVLKKLIELEPSNVDYYKSLIVLYKDEDNQAQIDALINSVKDEDLKHELETFDAAMPVPTFASGEYNTPISVGLTGPDKSTIYYTVNGGDATVNSTVYSKPIELNVEGEYIIKAVAVSGDDNEVSDQFVGTYVLKFTTVSAPVVNLDSGVYHEREKLVVKAEDGCRIFYTTDGTIPTKDSKEYKKPIKIPEKNTVYYFIAMDEKGVYSDYVTRAFDFRREYKVSVDSAVSSVKSVLVSNGTMENSFGQYKDGSAMYLAFEKLQKIDTTFYYIISATKESSTQSTIFTDYFAVNSDTGEVTGASRSGEGFSLSSIASHGTSDNSDESSDD